jgi:hypothetical protein
MALPPYAKELAQARRQGLVPALDAGWFLVALGWSVHKQVPAVDRYPRVVLPLDVAVQDYDLRPLAGLDLLLVYERSDAGRIQEVADCLLAIKPRSLTSCPIDDPAGHWHYWHHPGESLLKVSHGA